MARRVRIDEFLFTESNAGPFVDAALAHANGQPGTRAFVGRERRQGRGNGLILTEWEGDGPAGAGWRDSRPLADAVTAGTLLPVWEDLRFSFIAQAAKPVEGASDGPRWVQLTETTCAPEHEAAFNQWYNEVHLADAMHRPDYLSATRFEADAPVNGRGRYLTLYEIATHDIEAAMEDQARRTAAEKAAGRGSSLPIPVWNKVLFRQVSGGPAGR